MFFDGALFCLQDFSGEVLTLAMAAVSFGAIVLLFWGFGGRGLLAYIVLGSVVANVQVLKTAVLTSTPEPMVLGTVVFTSLFWAMEVVTEYEGAAAARKMLLLSFVMPFLMVLWMGLAIAHAPFPAPANWKVQEALETLFKPAPALFCASVIAYLVSQWADIGVFAVIKRLTQGRFVALRATAAALISGFLDNALFSLLAWKVFAIQEMPLSQLFWTYMVGAYGLRALLSLGAAPLLHVIRMCVPQGAALKIDEKGGVC